MKFSLLLVAVVCIQFILVRKSSGQTPGCCDNVKVYGDSLNEIPIRIKHYQGFTYLAGRTQINGQEHALCTKLTSANDVVWQYYFDTPSTINDFIQTSDGSFLLVGNTLPFSSSNKSILARILPNGTIDFIRTYNISNRESFIRIVEHPAPQNSNFPYYISGLVTISGSSDDVQLHNLDALGNISWTVEYSYLADDQYFQGIIPLFDGNLILTGNSATPQQGNLIKINGATGAPLSGIKTLQNMEFNDGVELNNGQIVVSGRDIANSDAFLSLFSSDLSLLSSTRFFGEQIIDFPEIKKDASESLITAGIMGVDSSVICKATIINNEIVFQQVKRIANGTSSLAWLDVVGTNMHYTDNRTNHPSGSGGVDVLIARLTTDLGDSCLVSKVFNDSITNYSTDTISISHASKTLPPPTLVINLDTLALNLSPQCPESTPTCIAFFSYQNLGCGSIQLTDLSTGSLPFSYCWDFDGDLSTCESTEQNPILQASPCDTVVNACLIITTADTCQDTVCMTINVIPDTVPPSITCPLDSSFNCWSDVPVPFASYSTFFAAGGLFTDNCALDTTSFFLQQAFTSGVECPLTITRIYQIADQCGNVSTCQQIHAVQDSIPPMIQCPLDTTLDCGSQAIFDVYNNLTEFLQAGGNVTDNCLIDSTSFALNSAIATGPFCSRLITRSYVISDDCENTATCFQVIAVQDTTAPIISCSPDTTVSSLDSLPVLTLGEFFTLGGYFIDFCALNNSSFTLVSEVSDNQKCPEIVVRTYGVSDSCGNQGTCMQYIAVLNDSCCVFSQDTNATVFGDLNVTGDLAVQGNKCFVIPHPLNPDNQLLAHSCVEAPQRLNIYSGIATTDKRGLARVSLPNYFMALNKNYRYQLTPIGSLSTRAVISQEIDKHGTFIIKSNKKHAKISWQVTGERDDPYARENPFTVEMQRSE